GGGGRAAPNAHADSGGPTPRGRAAAPGTAPRPVPILIRSRRRGHSKSGGLSPQGRVPFGRAHGRGGSSGDCSLFSAALRRGSGGPWEGASAPSPFSPGQLRADPVSSPDPPPRRRQMHTADQREAGTAGVPSKRPAAGAAAQDARSDSSSTDNGLSSLRLTPSAPVRRRLAGRAVAQCLTKRLTSNTSLVCSMW